MFSVGLSKWCPLRTKKVFPRLHEAASKTVTVVIPAYNEEERIKIMLDEMLEFLERHAARVK